MDNATKLMLKRFNQIALTSVYFVFQNDSVKMPVTQYMKGIMNWNCTEDHSNLVKLHVLR